MARTTVKDRLDRIEAELARLRQIVEKEGTQPQLGANHPLARFAGRLRDEPLLDAWRENVEVYRRELDRAEGLP